MNDDAIVELQKIDWESLTVPQAKQAAIDYMATWDWQEKVPEYTRGVEQKQSVKQIAYFMWNATMSGLEMKKKSMFSKIDR